MSGFDQFKEVFITEAYELLDEMEQKLLAIDVDEPDNEEINAIFRCAHSIKGGAGAFGFSRLIAFTHVAEFLLDAIRNHQIALTRDIIDALLESVDVISAFLASAQSGEEAVEGIEDELKASLENLNKVNGNDVVEEEDEYGIFDEAALDEVFASNKRVVRKFSIFFKPEKDLFLSGNEPLFIIKELSRLGEMEYKTDISKLPSLEGLDPLECYISWNISITTDQDISRIKEVFEFVEGECQLDIELLEELQDNSVATAVDDEAAFGLFDDEPAPVKVEVTPKGQGVVSKPLVEKAIGNKNSGKAPAVSSLRVDIDKIDKMVNMVGEIVITQAMIMQRLKEVPAEYSESLNKGIDELSRYTRDLQEAVMSVRMQPVKSVFSRLPRIVRDISKKLGKKVNIIMQGESTEIDKTVIEQLADPLVHMIRNSVDHGIESPQKRLEKGKPEEGTIVLSADNSGGRILIEIKDDGAGINREKVKQIAIEKGIIAEDANISNEEIDLLIFAPGFSTAAEVTDVSGRGVGMDVVRKNIKDLGGDFEVDNRPGEGLTFLISLPLTLAILDGMIIAVGQEKYIIPINSIIETMQVSRSEINNVKGNDSVINVRGEFIPLVSLSAIFDVQNTAEESSKLLVVLVEYARNKLGIIVDELLGQQQVVIKNLEENSDPVEGISGATILGDGNVSLILDIAQISKMQAANKRALGIDKKVA